MAKRMTVVLLALLLATQAARSAAERLEVRDSAGRLVLAIDQARVQRDGGVVYVQAESLALDDRSCRVSVTGHSRVELGSVVAGSVEIHVDGHATLRIDEVTAANLGAGASGFGRVVRGANNDSSAQEGHRCR